MAHRHLILAYVLTWVIQLGYAGVLAAKWRALKRTNSTLPGHDRLP